MAHRSLSRCLIPTTRQTQHCERSLDCNGLIIYRYEESGKTGLSFLRGYYPTELPNVLALSEAFP